MTPQDTNPSGLLRALYGANILGAGIPGALITLAPAFAETTLLWGPQDPAMLSLVGSIWLAIGLTSIGGLFAPQRLLGVFVVQVIYKTIWLLTFVLPAALTGTLRPEAWVLVGIFLFLIVAALLVVPRHILRDGRPTLGTRATQVHQAGGQR